MIFSGIIRRYTTGGSTAGTTGARGGVSDKVTKHMLRTVSILMLILALGGTIALAQATRPAAQPVRKTVNMKGMTFAPASVTIKVGDTIVWNNDDDRDHTVVDGGGAFKSDNIRAGGSYSFRFTKAGTYTYTCSYHPRMKATIVVTDK